jgi:hypothetical protein
MSNLGFELWWAGSTTTLLATQPEIGSLVVAILLQCSEQNNFLGSNVVSTRFSLDDVI